MTTFSFSDARTHFTEVYQAAASGSAALIERRGSTPVAMIDRDAVDELLADRHPFNPQVEFTDDGSVEMWLEELPVHGQGATFEAAGLALVDALISYAEIWVQELRHAPNHRNNRGWVQRVQLRGEDRSELFTLIFEG